MLASVSVKDVIARKDFKAFRTFVLLSNIAMFRVQVPFQSE